MSGIREVTSAANGVVKIANAGCNAAPGWARPVCKQTVGRYTGWIYNNWMYAKKHNMCPYVAQTWTGQVVNIKPYSCNRG